VRFALYEHDATPALHKRLQRPNASKRYPSIQAIFTDTLYGYGFVELLVRGCHLIDDVNRVLMSQRFS
jgi:hypothetical protein